MKMYKKAINFFWIFFLIVFSTAALSEIKVCELNVSVVGLKKESCTEQDGGIVVVKLVPIDRGQFANKLDNVPSFIVLGNDFDAVIKVVGDGTGFYNNLVNLPYPEQIISYSDAASTAKLKMVKEGWDLLNMKNIVYGRQDGEDGPGLVCGTFSKKVGGSHIVVSQCNAFYGENISSLKSLLDIVAGESK